jgi:radical S-adenosyl methionine domain-containing protein 2
MKQQNNSEFKPVPAVNFHLWQPCNMRCRFCFASFEDVKQTLLPKGHLPKEDAISVVKALCHAGFQKITFVGGEPTLCPWLADLIKETKAHGLTTMMVTNGSRLTPDYLQQLKPVLDWLCLSIDSLNAQVNEAAGRKQNNTQAFDEAIYRQLVTMIKEEGFRFKINTVVHRLNCGEDMSAFIHWAKPERWKLFRVLPVQGQNNGLQNDMLITAAAFKSYVTRHTNNGCNPVAEENEDMQGSYAMVDPAGRFYDSAKGYHSYSEPILNVGIAKAYTQVIIKQDVFEKRGGLYKWR